MWFISCIHNKVKSVNTLYMKICIDGVIVWAVRGSHRQEWIAKLFTYKHSSNSFFLIFLIFLYCTLIGINKWYHLYFNIKKHYSFNIAK